jgi:import receptor subunit TOM70
LDPDFVFSHIQLGVTQYKQGFIVSSDSTFNKIIKKFPDVPDVYNYYGELLLDQKHYQKAVEHFDKAIELEKTIRPTGVNVLPIVNKALAVHTWTESLRQEHKEIPELCRNNDPEELCKKALLRKLSL